MSDYDSDAILAMIRWLYVRQYPKCRGISPAMLNARVHKLAKSFKIDDLADHAVFEFRVALEQLFDEIGDFPGELCSIVDEVYSTTEQECPLRLTLSGVLAEKHRWVFRENSPNFADLRNAIINKHPSLGLDILGSMARNAPKSQQDTFYNDWLSTPFSRPDLAHRPGHVARRASIESADSEIAVYKDRQTSGSLFDPNKSDSKDSWLQTKNAGGKITDNDGVIRAEQENSRDKTRQESWVDCGSWQSKYNPPSW
jgi:hypothetical protein